MGVWGLSRVRLGVLGVETFENHGYMIIYGGKFDIFAFWTIGWTKQEICKCSGK